MGDKAKRFRVHVAKELYETERDYTQNLEFTVTVSSRHDGWAASHAAWTALRAIRYPASCDIDTRCHLRLMRRAFAAQSRTVNIGVAYLYAAVCIYREPLNVRALTCTRARTHTRTSCSALPVLASQGPGERPTRQHLHRGEPASPLLQH